MFSAQNCLTHALRLERQIGCVNGCVSYLVADVKGYRLSDGTDCDGGPAVLLDDQEIIIPGESAHRHRPRAVSRSYGPS